MPTATDSPSRAAEVSPPMRLRPDGDKNLPPSSTSPARLRSPVAQNRGLSPARSQMATDSGERPQIFAEFLLERIANARDFDTEYELAVRSPARTGTNIVGDRIRMWKRGHKLRTILFCRLT